VAVALKLALLALETFPFHADEAVVGLMARHILQGRWPAFFYGQAYMGSVDASLVAAAFALFGEGVGAIRLVQVGLYSGTVLTAMRLAEEVSSSPAVPIAAGALMAIPTVNVTLYTTVSLGGYGEALLIGNLLLLIGLWASRSPSETRLSGLWATLAGLGFWGFGLTLVYSLPSGILLFRSLWRSLDRPGFLRRAAVIVGGAALGAAPWLWSVASTGVGSFLQELLGSAIAGSSPARPLAYLGSHALNLLIFGSTATLGLRPPWEVRWLAWPLLPVAVAFWIAALGLAARRLRADRAARARWLLLGVTSAVVVGFWLTPFGADPSGRYFLPLAVPLAIWGAELAQWLAERVSRTLAIAAVLAVIGFNLVGTLQSALQNPPGITTQFAPDARIDAADVEALVPLLGDLGETRGYSTYWVAYPLAFLSGEELIFVPKLPYHADLRYTERDNRYAPYNGMVESAQSVAYITSLQPELDRLIRSGLAEHGATWKETMVGDLRVFYRLSEPIPPEELPIRSDGAES
jgi:hypothetical protein